MKNNFVSGFLFCLLLASFIGIPYIWPPVLNLVFNSIFWSAVLLFGMCGFLVAYLYRKGGSASRGTRFCFGLLLIFSASFMYSGFEQIATNTSYWEPFLKKDYPSMFLLLSQFLGYAKNIVSLGFAALGASIAANAIIENEKRV